MARKKDGDEFDYDDALERIAGEREKERAARAAKGKSAALLVTRDDVDAARHEYIGHLDAARLLDRSDSFELTDRDRISLEMYRARYDAFSAAWREQADERATAESRALATTNTQLAQSQTSIAKAVAAFTFLQLALAVAQAMHWIH